MHLKKLNGSEKARFLSLDLAERMIRVEQNVSASFNRNVPYNQTAYYKSLSPVQKKNVDNFILHKSRRKIAFLFFLTIPLLLILLLNISFTGNYARDYFSENQINYAIYTSILVFAFLTLYALFGYLEKRSKEKKYLAHQKVIDGIFYSKYSTRKKK